MRNRTVQPLKQDPTSHSKTLSEASTYGYTPQPVKRAPRDTPLNRQKGPRRRAGPKHHYNTKPSLTPPPEQSINLRTKFRPVVLILLPQILKHLL